MYHNKVPCNSSQQSWKSKAKLVAVPARAELTRSRWSLILRVSLCFRSHPRPQVLASSPPIPILNPPPPFPVKQVQC